VHPIVFLFLALLNWEEVNCLVFENLSLFNVPEVGTQHFKGIVTTHREPLVVIRCSCGILLMS